MIYVDDVISTTCFYSVCSSVTGFQIIVHLNNVNEVHKLHINSTTEHLSTGPVTVRVEENKTYQVAIFPIMSNRGMIATIAYSEVLSPTGMYVNISYLATEYHYFAVILYTQPISAIPSKKFLSSNIGEGLNVEYYSLPVCCSISDNDARNL